VTLRPLTPVPIVLWSALAAALLWSSEQLDDVAGCASAVVISHLLLWLGMRGDPAQPASRGGRVALAVGGAIPAAACLLTLIPWLARGDGMASLGMVVMMMIFGVPLGVAALAVLIHRTSDGPRHAVLRRILALVTGTTALAWALALAWRSTRADASGDTTTVLVFPALATWWLLLVLAEALAPRPPQPR
jgi:hypothetical protein